MWQTVGAERGVAAAKTTGSGAAGPAGPSVGRRKPGEVTGLGPDAGMALGRG